jgi:hypothetical protein
MAGLPDLDLWIRFCMKYEIRILNKKLVRFRWIGDKNNTSGDTNSNRIRNRFESLKILDNYLKITKLDELLLVFPEAVKYGKLVEELIPYYLGRMAIDIGPEYKVLWGLSIISNILQDQALADILEKQYDFTYSSFIKFTSMYDVFRITSSIPTYQGLSVPRRSAFRAFLSASKRYSQEMLLIIRESKGK